MEEGQRHLATKLIQQLVMRLNPCCNGRGSKTYGMRKAERFTNVLILVVMEEGQRHGQIYGQIREGTS